MNIQIESIEKQIREYIAHNLLFSGESFPYPDDASLLDEGIIDSLGIMELVEFAQQAFAIRIDQNEVIPENFDSVRKMALFVQSKL
ncbi:MAG: acyl carrier protein [Dongiaceae bacterium]